MPDYNPNIPQPTDRPSKSQSQILGNFGQANTIFGVDHVPFDDSTVANRGYHKKITIQNIGAAPVVPAGTCELYTEVDAQTGNQELFFKNSDSSRALTPTLRIATYCSFRPTSAAPKIYNAGDPDLLLSKNILKIQTQSVSIGSFAWTYTVTFGGAYPDSNYIPQVFYFNPTQIQLISFSTTTMTFGATSGVQAVRFALFSYNAGV